MKFLFYFYFFKASSFRLGLFCSYWFVAWKGGVPNQFVYKFQRRQFGFWNSEVFGLETNLSLVRTHVPPLGKNDFGGLEV